MATGKKKVVLSKRKGSVSRASAPMRSTSNGKVTGAPRKKAANSRGPDRRIDAAHKTLVVAAEPPIDSNLQNLTAPFRSKLLAALSALDAQSIPFKFVEGFRTVDRQQWLYGSGRPSVTPYGRAGRIVTNADGVTKRSNHQGNGTPGSGKAADCYPMKNGKVYIPANADPVWDAYAAAVTAQGLVAGQNFSSIKDSPHCEMPK